MKKLKAYVVKNKVWIIVILLIAGWFYWFQWRPVEIRKDCSVIAMNGALKENGNNGRYVQKQYDHYYGVCLQSAGLR